MNALETQPTEKQLTNLARLVRLHGFACKVEKKHLYCRAELTKVDSDGKIVYVWERVNPTIESVKHWLGY